MVEADYPNSPFRVGDVLTVKHHPLYADGEVFGLEEEQDVLKEITYAKDYPHIFRLMHWSEGRKLEDMPRWVRLRNGSSRVCEVSEWVKSKSRPNEFYTVLSWGNTGGQFWAHMVNPATEAEYLEYLKSKEK